MSVLINDMEMPTSCFYCPFRIKVDPDNIKCLVSGVVFEETFTGSIEMRHSGDCPLVPVPPHGRLIDADALEQECQKRLLVCTDQFQRPYEVLRAIALASTIIETEEAIQ